MATLAVMALFAASRLAIVGIASEREYDEGVYLLSARAVAAGETLFTQVFSSQPPAFLESLALVFRVTGDTLAHAQVFSLAWALLAMAATAWVARRLAGPAAAPLAAAALAVGETFTNLAHMVQAEVPSIALAMLSMALVIEARQRGWNRTVLLGSGAVFGLALLFKLFAAPLALPIALLLALEGGGEEAQPFRLDLRGFLPRALGWGMTGAAVLLLPLLIYDPKAVYAQTVAFHVAKFAAYHPTPTANLWRAWRVLADDWVVSTAAMAGLGLLSRRDRLAAGWLTVWLAAMVFVVRKQTPLFWRHLVLVSPPVALLAACAFALPLSRAGRSLRSAAVTLAIVTMAVPVALHPDNARALVPTIPHPSWMPWPLRATSGEETAPVLVQTAQWIRKNTATDELVGGDDPIAIYLAGRRAPGQLCDTSQARIAARSLTLEAASTNSAQARVIVLRKDGRLSGLEGFLAWLARHYERQDPWSVDIGLGRSVWIRKTMAPPAE